MTNEFDRPSLVNANPFDELAQHLRRIKEVKRSADGHPVGEKPDLRKVTDIMKTLHAISRGNSGSQH